MLNARLATRDSVSFPKRRKEPKSGRWNVSREKQFKNWAVRQKNLISIREQQFCQITVTCYLEIIICWPLFNGVQRQTKLYQQIQSFHFLYWTVSFAVAEGQKTEEMKQKGEPVDQCLNGDKIRHKTSLHVSLFFVFLSPVSCCFF